MEGGRWRRRLWAGTGALAACAVITTVLVRVGRAESGPSAPNTAGAYEGYAALGTNGAIRYPASAASLLNPVPVNETDLTLGREVYAEYCEVCHGPDLRGRGPGGNNLSPRPADLRAPHLNNLAPGQIYWIVSNGLVGSGMPPWRLLLTSEQRWAVVDFVASNLLPTPAPDPQLPPAQDLPAQGAVSVLAGQSIYTDDCETCHGINGEGMGPAGRYLAPRPADLTAPYIVSYTDPQLSTIIADGVPGTPMLAWGGILSPTERAYVIAYLRKLQGDTKGSAGP